MNLIFLTRTASEDGITSHGYKHEKDCINTLCCPCLSISAGETGNIVGFFLNYPRSPSMAPL